MKRIKKVPFSWKLEKYVFGAVALRDEIIRHKKEDTKPWNPVKALGIRVLYVYALIVAFFMMGPGLLFQVFQKKR